MPNGVDAMASIAVHEGRANRIADYTNQERKGGKRAAGTLRSQAARLRAGLMFRQQMARRALAGLGRMTHGGGGIASHRQTKGGKANLKQFKKRDTEYQEKLHGGVPYSKARAKLAGYKAQRAGAVSSGWAKTSVPSLKSIESTMKRTTPGRSKRRK